MLSTDAATRNQQPVKLTTFVTKHRRTGTDPFDRLPEKEVARHLNVPSAAVLVGLDAVWPIREGIVSQVMRALLRI